MDETEIWRPINYFEKYDVSDLGRVRNARTHHVLRPYVNYNGHCHVGLVKGGRQLKRGVALLVAEEFLPPPQSKHFDTPINLDGDTTNNAAYNLAWRPRWFSYKYRRQSQKYFNVGPVQDVETGLVYESPWVAAIRFGLIEEHIIDSIMYGDLIFPTRQRFIPLEFTT